MDRFVSMAVFAKAVETGSFSAAAEALSTSSQVVGRHVRQLEEQLGVQLINRTTRRQSLTDLGRSYYERVQHILAEVESAEALAAQSRAVPRGRLRVNAPVTFGAYELARVLPEYMRANTEVDVDLNLADRTVDLIDEGFDAVFRVGVLSDSGLIARSLRPHEYTLCAAPSYLETHGTPRTPRDLIGRECLTFAHGTTRDHWTLDGPNGAETIDVSHRFLANNGQALLTAALAGLGLMLQPTPLMRDALASGQLIRLLPDYKPRSRPMHILYAPDRRITPKLRTFIDFVVSQFG